MERLQFKLV